MLGLAGALALVALPAGVATASVAPAPTAHGPSWVGARTLTYCDQDGVPLSMTLFAPADGTHPVPVVLQVHGGGWREGTRLTSLDQSTTATDLVRAGFMVVSVDYRLAPRYLWPDQIVDVECAVRALRAHAADLGIDPDRMAALGDSAGGQLVSLLGTTAGTHQWDEGPYPAESSAVEAVVDEFGPEDLTGTDWPHGTADLIRNAFGAGPDSDAPVLKAASPLDYVVAGDPPFLILQGTDDQVVPAAQSETFADRLRAAKVPVDLVLVRGGQHGLKTPGEDPSPDELSALITSFLVRTLHP
jgi:acetyl esterase/lipase